MMCTNSTYTFSSLKVGSNHKVLPPQHMVLVHSYGVRKGAWAGEEDALLRRCIEKYGEGNWHQVPVRAGLNRCRKSCRLRWLNYLHPNIKRGEFTSDEIDLIVRMHKLLGNRWSLIAGRLPGRTANDVKNYWNTHIHKRHLLSRSQPQQDNNSVIHTTVFKPQPRTFSKNSHWLRKRNEKLSSNIEEISNDNISVTCDQGTPWWETILFDNDENLKGTDPLTTSSSLGVESSNPCLLEDHIFDWINQQ